MWTVYYREMREEKKKKSFLTQSIELQNWGKILVTLMPLYSEMHLSILYELVFQLLATMYIFLMWNIQIYYDEHEGRNKFGMTSAFSLFMTFILWPVVYVSIYLSWRIYNFTMWDLDTAVLGNKSILVFCLLQRILIMYS